MYKYFIVDSRLPDDKCTFEYLSKNHFWGWDNYDSALYEFEDEIMAYGLKGEDLKIMKVMVI